MFKINMTRWVNSLFLSKVKLQCLTTSSTNLVVFLTLIKQLLTQLWAQLALRETARLLRALKLVVAKVVVAENPQPMSCLKL